MAESIKFDDKYIDTTGVYDSVSDNVLSDLITLKEIPLTADTDAVISHTCYCYQLGKLVILNIHMNINSGLGTSATLLTGVPKPLLGVGISMCAYNGAQRGYISKGTQIFRLDGVQQASAWLNGNVVYIAEDYA